MALRPPAPWEYMRREEYLQDPDETQIIEQQSIQSRIWTAIPGIVQEVDYTRFTLSVQPSIKGRIEDQDGNAEDVELPLLVDVPLLLPNAGGWHLTFPIVPGDEVLVVFACRCIDAWWQSGGVQKAMERRMHDLSDGFAILAPYSQLLAPDCIGGFSNNSVILRDDKKLNYIEITNDGKLNVLHQSDLDWDTLGNADIYIKGNTNLLIDGNTTAHIKGTLDSTVDGAVTLTANSTVDATVQGDITLTAASNVSATIGGNLDVQVSGNITAQASQVMLTANSVTVDSPITAFTGNVTIGGNISCGGGARAGGGNGTFLGTITANQDVVGGGISLKGHVHGGVQGGPSTTSGPQ